MWVCDYDCGCKEEVTQTTSVPSSWGAQNMQRHTRTHTHACTHSYIHTSSNATTHTHTHTHMHARAGDCALASGFVSYLGPFNKEFRELLINRDFYGDCQKLGIPVTEGMQVRVLLDETNT